MAQNTQKKVVPMGPGVRQKNRVARLKVRHLVVAAFLLWGGYVYLFVQRPMFARVTTERQELSSQLTLAQQESAMLTGQIHKLHTDSYIAAIAEQKYNLIMPGEILFTSGSKQ